MPFDDSPRNEPAIGAPGTGSSESSGTDVPIADPIGDGLGVDPQWSGLGPVVDRMRAATEISDGEAWVGRQAIVAAMAAVRSENVVTLPTSGRRARYMRTAAVAATVTLVATAGLAGLAAADTLPRPMQSVASRAAAVFGLHFSEGGDAPEPIAPAPSTAPTTQSTPAVGLGADDPSHGAVSDVPPPVDGVPATGSDGGAGDEPATGGGADPASAGSTQSDEVDPRDVDGDGDADDLQSDVDPADDEEGDHDPASGDDQDDQDDQVDQHDSNGPNDDSKGNGGSKGGNQGSPSGPGGGGSGQGPGR